MNSSALISGNVKEKTKHLHKISFQLFVWFSQWREFKQKALTLC